MTLPSTSLIGTTLTEGEGAAGLSLILAPKFELWAWLSSTRGVADMTVGVAGRTVGVADCEAGDWRFNNSRLKVSCPISCIESPFESKDDGGVGEVCNRCKVARLVTEPCVSVVVPSSRVTRRLCRFIPLFTLFGPEAGGGSPPKVSVGLLLEEIGIESLLEPMSIEATLALLSFSSFCLCLELRIVIGIILSPALESVSRGRSEAVEDVMMVFSSIMAAWQRLFFYARMFLHLSTTERQRAVRWAGRGVEAAAHRHSGMHHLFSF